MASTQTTIVTSRTGGELTILYAPGRSFTTTDQFGTATGYLPGSTAVVGASSGGARMGADRSLLALGSGIAIFVGAVVFGSGLRAVI